MRQDSSLSLDKQVMINRRKEKIKMDNGYVVTIPAEVIAAAAEDQDLTIEFYLKIK